MAKAVHCIFMGGLGGLVPPFYYSNGLKDLSAKLRALSPLVKTTILHHDQDAQAYEIALQALKAGAHLALHGHSLGADSVRQLAERLNNGGVKPLPVALIGSFDPTWNMWGRSVPANVSRCLNFHNTSWLSLLGKKTLSPGPGFKGHLANIPMNILHQNVDDDLSAHGMIVREVAWLLDPKMPVPKLPVAAVQAESLRTGQIIAAANDPRELPPG
jgi:hypothetical protein